jgi:hypothetical protein
VKVTSGGAIALPVLKKWLLVVRRLARVRQTLLQPVVRLVQALALVRVQPERLVRPVQQAVYPPARSQAMALLQLGF